MSNATATSSSSAVKILNKRYYTNDATRQLDLQAARTSARIARKIYQLRQKEGLTQKQLAQKVGTTASVISRLENDDYDGHSLKMLQRIAGALTYQVDVRFTKLKQASAA